MTPESRRKEIISFLKALREEIIKEFERLEGGSAFDRQLWDHKHGGGGEISILRGKVFEKAAVNWSGVYGDKFPLADGKGPFFATGISIITHMQNPHAPTVHMNIRYIDTEEEHWFGGGYDLTPMGFPYEEDTLHFHHTAKECLGETLYQQFSANARAYFYIPHRNKERGVGGIFFDHLNSGHFHQDFTLWQRVGTTFLDAIVPIYKRRILQHFTQAERKLQLRLRSHYAEFNLLYDRGTKFGFQSGGNPEAILCSMPPLAQW